MGIGSWELGAGVGSGAKTALIIQTPAPKATAAGTTIYQVAVSFYTYICRVMREDR